jgi:hypothetical protein
MAEKDGLSATDRAQIGGIKIRQRKRQRTFNPLSLDLMRLTDIHEDGSGADEALGFQRGDGF